MNVSLRDSLKTVLDDAVVKTRVFSTNKRLNERFTHKKHRFVFILNNGYTIPYENNNVEERIVFPNRRTVEINKRLSLDEVEGKCIPMLEDSEENKLDMELDQLAHKRRVVLMPRQPKCENSFRTKLYNGVRNEASTSECVNPESSTPKKSKKFKRKKGSVASHFSKLHKESIKSTVEDLAKYYSKADVSNSESNEPIVFSPFLQLYENNLISQPSVYTWKRKRPATKAELDDEIDSYMAEIRFRKPSPPKDDVDFFVQEYMVEAEKTLTQNDSSVDDDLSVQ